MPKKPMEVITESMFYILLAFQDGECCGTDIAAHMEQKTGGRVKIGPATMYTILGRFEQDGTIEETRVEGRKRTYRITPKGQQFYLNEIRRLEACLADARGEERQ